jgi:hypothetical protein
MPLSRRAFSAGAALVLGLGFANGACARGTSKTGTTAAAPTGITSVASAATEKREPTTFRLVGRPVVVYYAAPGHSAQWAVVARLNKALPSGSDHRPRADLRIDHEPSEARPSRVGSRNGRACYVASYGSENDKSAAPQLVKPHDGQRVTVTLYFNKRKFMNIWSRAERRDSLGDVNSEQGIQPYLARLGCAS